MPAPSFLPRGFPWWQVLLWHPFEELSATTPWGERVLVKQRRSGTSGALTAVEELPVVDRRYNGYTTRPSTSPSVSLPK